MKKFSVFILAAVLIFTSVVSYSQNLSESLSENIVRLHIIAQSNSQEDQEVKLKIRDAILEQMETFDESEDICRSLKKFEATANKILMEEGFEYKAHAEYGRFEFPTKYYKNFALPKGEYDAVRIKLGRAEGENWWCVLFPPLCMIDAATDESEAALREVFGENYSIVTGEEKLSVRVKFKLAELF